MEIERKYLITTLPEQLEQYPCQEIEQGYLNVEPVMRIRRSNDRYFFTYKGSGLMVREEYNLPLTEEAYLHLREKIDGRLIEKRRYLIPYKGDGLKEKYTIELDIFGGSLAPLKLAEVEFETEDEARHFIPPEWFGEDVTFSPAYQNSRLSSQNNKETRMPMKAKITINPQNTISEIDPRLYSSFIEHMGRAVYTGIYEPDHPTADKDGLRQDVLDLIAPLQLSHIRYPGGNFVSGYRWEDGVGPKENRPVRRELAWSATETNEFGTNEFMDFCHKTGVQPMMAVNLGTRGPQDAANLVEYCNVPSGTCYSDLRRSHGYENPHNVKLWCLGNEMDGPWQIGMKTADEYGRIACETAKMMKWMDPSIELVLCGSSAKDMPTFGSWERTVLRHCYEHADYLSLHQYYNDNDNDLATFLARPTEMDAFIKEVAAICEEIRVEKQSDKQIYLSFDEWNVWFHFQKEGKRPPLWMKASPIEEEKFEFVDALVVAGMLNTLIKNSDRVKIACLAQLVNVIAPIMTVPGGGAYLQTIYHPFYAASHYGRGTAVNAEIDCPTYQCAVSDSVPCLDASAVLSENGDFLNLFLINRSLTEEIETEFELPAELTPSLSLWSRMTSEDLHKANTIDAQPIQPVDVTELPACANGRVTLTIPAASYQVIRFALK